MAIYNEIKFFMDKSMDKFERVIQNLKPENLNVQIQEKEGGWTVIELLRHIVNSERGMIRVIEIILEGGEGASPDFDIARYNAASQQKMQQITLDELVRKMRKRREKTLELMRNVKDDQWELVGRHPSQTMYTIRKQFEIISWHQQYHLKGIIEKFGM